ncbi:MAG TPA: hypothetical protein VJJ26_00515 [Candidatus Babeliales bacterium]|nr:hypothetical protein [Candidatus Babeliales bacterium]
MLKKTLLSTLFAVSTIASANINLDLNLTISNGAAQRNATGSVVINEDEITSVVFNDLEALVIDFVAQRNDENITIQAQFFQRAENDELITMTDWLSVEVPFDQAATITVNEADGSGSLVLVVTPSSVE